jgi:hypothetical protein
VSSTAPAFAAGTASATAPVSAPASAAAPSNLHICPAEKVTFLTCILIDPLSVSVTNFLGAVEISIFVIFREIAY